MSEIRVDNILSADGSAAPTYSQGVNVAAGKTFTNSGDFTTAGISSFSGPVTFGTGAEITGVTTFKSDLNNVRVSGVTTFADGALVSGLTTFTSGVSGLTISDFTFYFPSLTIRDFAERGDSSFTLDGTKFILMPPSIQNPVAISQTAATPIPSTITVATTNYFPSEGYLFHNNGSFTGVIKYTGKTANTFTGCTLHNGDDQIASGSEIVPITID